MRLAPSKPTYISNGQLATISTVIDRPLEPFTAKNRPSRELFRKAMEWVHGQCDEPRNEAQLAALPSCKGPSSSIIYKQL